MARHGSDGGRFPRLRNAARAALFFTPAGRSILSSPAGGLGLNFLSARDFRRREDEALARLDEINELGGTITSETLGVGGSNIRILDTIDAFPGQRANLEARIAANEPLGELEQFTERIPSATERAGDIAREGITRGDKLFDPESAVDRFDRSFASVSEGLAALPGQVLAGNQAEQDFFSQETADFAVQAAGLNEGNAALLQTARGLVSSLGGQERTDINRAFNELDIFRQQEASSRGVGGGTVASSIQTGVARERTDALGRLNERLINQQLGVEATFGLSAQGAAERLIGADVNLGAAQAQALQSGNQFSANTALSVLNTQGTIAGGRVAAFDQAAVNRQNNLLTFGGFQTDAQLRAAQLGLQFTGPFTVAFPSANTGATIFPEFQ